MFFLFSGEGSTDLGVGFADASSSEAADFAPGPLALIASLLAETHLGFNIIDLSGSCGLISEVELGAEAKTLRPTRKSLGLPGLRREKETRYFFDSARALARLAQRLSESQGDPDVVAILFRDADCRTSAGRGEPDAKWQSMLDGFAEEASANGVPMMPRPISEAWLVCALKTDPYQNCEPLEERSGHDDSPHSLKAELARCLGQNPDRDLLCEMVRDNRIEPFRIEMPSFDQFRARLDEVLLGIMRTDPPRSS